MLLCPCVITRSELADSDLHMRDDDSVNVCMMSSFQKPSLLLNICS